MSKNKITLKYLAKNFSIILGVVLVWRGAWYTLDELDRWIFGSNHIWTALLSLFMGLVILYIPDKDLKEIENF